MRYHRVVDEEDFEGLRQVLQYRRQLLNDRFDGRFLVVDGDDDREFHAVPELLGRSCVRARAR